jgi:hypothetical protein
MRTGLLKTEGGIVLAVCSHIGWRRVFALLERSRCVQCITPPTERSVVCSFFEVSSLNSVSGSALGVVVVHVCDIGFLGVPSKHISGIHCEEAPSEKCDRAVGFISPIPRNQNARPLLGDAPCNLNKLLCGAVIPDKQDHS